MATRKLRRDPWGQLIGGALMFAGALLVGLAVREYFVGVRSQDDARGRLLNLASDVVARYARILGRRAPAVGGTECELDARVSGLPMPGIGECLREPWSSLADIVSNPYGDLHATLALPRR